MPIATIAEKLAALQSDAQMLIMKHPGLVTRGPELRGHLQDVFTANGFTVMQAHDVISHDSGQWFVRVQTMLFHKDIENGSKPWNVNALHMPIETPATSPRHVEPTIMETARRVYDTRELMAAGLEIRPIGDPIMDWHGRVDQAVTAGKRLALVSLLGL